MVLRSHIHDQLAIPLQTIFSQPLSARDSDNTFVALSLSGGGTRAAAFAYGVLEELRATDIGGGRSMLDEADVISSVSGGSFAAAYYGLFGPKTFFTEFPDAVLYRRIERDLVLRVLAPWNWPRLLSPFFGRGDLADEYYGNHIFKSRTFAHLPRKRPYIMLNATDISRGAQFSFTQEHFDRICSDLGPLAISRGVVASSAFPIGFTPITFKNHGKETCGYEAPEWVGNSEQISTSIRSSMTSPKPGAPTRARSRSLRAVPRDRDRPQRRGDDATGELFVRHYRTNPAMVRRVGSSRAGFRCQARRVRSARREDLRELRKRFRVRDRAPRPML